MGLGISLSDLWDLHLLLGVPSPQTFGFSGYQCLLWHMIKSRSHCDTLYSLRQYQLGPLYKLSPWWLTVPCVMWLFKINNRLLNRLRGALKGALGGIVETLGYKPTSPSKSQQGCLTRVSCLRKIYCTNEYLASTLPCG